MSQQPLGLFIQPACLQHKYIRHANSSHIFERPERLRAVLLGVAAAIARIEELDSALGTASNNLPSQSSLPSLPSGLSENTDLSALLSSLSIGSTAGSSFIPPQHLDIVPPPTAPRVPGQILQHHPALQLAHSPPPDEGIYEGRSTASSTYLRDLLKWATEAVDKIKETGCEIPSGLGLNQGDLYLGPGSVLAIEGAIQTVCQAIDRVCDAVQAKVDAGVLATPPLGSTGNEGNYFAQSEKSQFNKAFCAVRPPGHHCGEDEPSGFCYVNNVVVGALHAYLEHDIDRAIIIDFDLHHGNGTQALVMPLNAATYAEELAVKAGKPSPAIKGKKGKRVRGWKGFYGSVHDIYSYPCEDGDLDLISDASIGLAAHGQYIENIHLQPYSSEEDFYERIYPKYLALLERAKAYMEETQAEPDRTIVLIRRVIAPAGFDACEHEHQAMQRHDRRVPVSFFSRYTRDIVAFADKHTEGKIVSVLEGGYSDRALTSAAMGHIAGLLDREGQPHWWSETELNNIEKATKKRRTGKIAPFPAEYASHTHLARTHALLAHFEGTAPDTIVPSTQTTPQHATRMTLRDRRKPALGEEDVAVTPPPARKAARGKSTGTTPRATPAKTAAKVENESVPSVPPVAWPIKAEPQSQPQAPAPPPSAPPPQPIPPTSAPTQLPLKRELTPPRSPPRRTAAEEDLVRSMESLGSGSLGSLGRVPSFRPDPPSPSSSFSRSPPASPQSPQRRASAISQLASISSLPPISSSILTQMSPPPATKVDAQSEALAQQPKIFLRFTRPGSSDPPAQVPGGLYPALPVSEPFAPGAGPNGAGARGAGFAYRESSAGLSTESEGEYVSARNETSS